MKLDRLARLMLLGIAAAALCAASAFADWNVEDPSKWIQVPDFIPGSGMDIRVDDSDGMHRVLADDFLCTTPSFITRVHIFGSWFNDVVGSITNVHLSFHTDFPGQPHSQPDFLLWEMDFDSSSIKVVPYMLVTGGHEWWWDPSSGSLPNPLGDTNIWQINVDIPITNAFFQEGGEQIYWLDLSVQTDGTGQFGWKTRLWTEHYQDDAVYWTEQGSWEELRYPEPHFKSTNSLDLAFVLESALDYGDAPDFSLGPQYQYPVCSAQNGACHIIVPGWYLGFSVDNETNGQPATAADGDDNKGLPDEDGVVYASPLYPGYTAQLSVVASTGGYLQGWVDFNADGDWKDTGEHGISNVLLVAGTNNVTFPVPSSAVLGPTYARLRFSSQTNLPVDGLALDGEVEDYRIEIGQGLEPKWSQPLDTEHGTDVLSFETMTSSSVVADDFVSDGRPIVGIRWWGSYQDWETNTPGPVAPPTNSRPPSFVLRWLKDVPAGAVTDYSMPGATNADITRDLSAWGMWDKPVQECYCTSILHEAEGVYEHEFVYELVLEDGAWNEKEGGVYWLSVAALYTELPSNLWGWATTSPDHHFNDDAVTNRQAWPGYGDLHYDDIGLGEVYGSNTADMAFELLTDVIGRRAKKWCQPPDMIHGENMPSFVDPWEPTNTSLRAEDFISDGRRITDIHWWGSYLGYNTNYAEPVMSPPPDPHRPVGFNLSWHTDIPDPDGPGPEYSMPDGLLKQIFVPLSECHEVFYGTVTQTWKATNYFEHEFQYYVDLLDPGLEDGMGPWPETNGVTYWLNIQAVMTNSWEPGMFHNGWGWKTTPLEWRTNDASVYWKDGGWLPAQYPPGHTNWPEYCDLAFELTTDAVGTNQFCSQIEFKKIESLGANSIVLRSVGDTGSGSQRLQLATNLVVSNWVDIATNALPLPPPFTNMWYITATNAWPEFFRIRQK